MKTIHSKYVGKTKQMKTKLHGSKETRYFKFNQYFFLHERRENCKFELHKQFLLDRT